jgi:hypothetical protein
MADLCFIRCNRSGTSISDVSPQFILWLYPGLEGGNLWNGLSSVLTLMFQKVLLFVQKGEQSWPPLWLFHPLWMNFWPTQAKGSLHRRVNYIAFNAHNSAHQHIFFPTSRLHTPSFQHWDEEKTKISCPQWGHCILETGLQNNNQNGYWHTITD